MAKNAVADWDSTAANNTDIGGLDITGTTGLVKNGDNAIRAIMAQIKAGVPYLSSTSVVMPSSTAALVADADDGASLGTTAVQWSDLFLASGGVINWANGDATLTHSASALTSNVTITAPGLVVSGNGTETAGSIVSNSFWGMYFRAKQASPLAGDFAWFNSAGTEMLRWTSTELAPKTDTYSLGAAAYRFVNLFLTSGGVINWNNGTYTLTQSGSALVASGSLTSSNATGGVGYSTGAGGTVTQATSKSTGVTLDKVTGRITMNGAALAAGTIVSFVLTDSAIAATDVLILNHVSGGTVGAYTLNAQAAAGSATINIRNNTGGSLSEALVIQFAVIKGVNA